MRARELGIDLGVELALVVPLLHGLTAARALPSRYPRLPDEIWQAIARHTIGAVDMSPLDMVLFVADGIEPGRPDQGGVRVVRGLYAEGAPLDDLYWASFYHGISYVIEGERYLYPGTLDIYNQLALARKGQRKPGSEHGNTCDRA
jgi:HD superfamily phosphohydrolase YqeK